MNRLLNYFQGNSSLARKLMEPADQETLPSAKVEAVHRKAKKDLILSHLLSCCIALLCLWVIFRFGEETHQGKIVFVVSIVVLGLFGGIEISRYLAWHRRAVEAAELGTFDPYYDPRWIQLLFRGGLGLCLIALLLTVSPENRLTAVVAVVITVVIALVAYISRPEKPEKENETDT